ncbi:Uncharacterised protein [Salmonella enterica subsp. enterica]|uniref:Uncharacterized protein n=1 Tax=Salmonella enterica I TaxID=59201 RepID=A0A379X2S5_SALET|nr:Uncharacterised protein [Salmonella enterica subsp. enterica]
MATFSDAVVQKNYRIVVFYLINNPLMYAAMFKKPYVAKKCADHSVNFFCRNRPFIVACDMKLISQQQNATGQALRFGHDK